MKRPTVNSANIENARRERTAKIKNSPDVRLNAIRFRLEEEFEDDAEGVRPVLHRMGTGRAVGDMLD
jgi:hypothetical protein